MECCTLLGHICNPTERGCKDAKYAIARPNAELFIATGCSHRIKNRLAAAAANHFPARCHHWQRPLPIMSPPAANRKSMAFFPLGQCAHPNLPTPLSLLSCAYQSSIPTFLISSALFCGMITLYTSHRSYLRRSPRLCKGRGSGCALFLTIATTLRLFQVDLIMWP